MKIYRVKWPDGDTELIFAESDEDLIFLLDQDTFEKGEGIVLDLEIEEVELAPIRINLKKRLKTLRDILELPIKRRLERKDVEWILMRIYDFPNLPTYLQ